MKSTLASLAALGVCLASPALFAAVQVIPKPVLYTPEPGSFQLTAEAGIAGSPETAAEAEYLAALLRPATGFRLPVDGRASAFVLRLDPDLARLGPEGYRLIVTPQSVIMASATRTGIFHCIQTFRQLLPAAVESRTPAAGADWTIPCGTIEDQPRFAWRGAMLDVGRHMLAVGEIKKFIDLMALQKLNVLHIHLTDDQGWRIEIKKYPKLTEVGSWRSESPKHGNRNQGDGRRYGGFFTQEQLKDVVAYAASRHITVVPEIEMPGHGLGALTAYPELGCTGGPYALRTRWGVEDDVFCAGNEQTYRFLEDVLAEVLEIFPSKIIHLGGDECPKVRWDKCPKCQAKMKANHLKGAHELQSYFVQHFDKWLSSRGRRLIGWDEILEGGLAPGAAVMSWRGTKGGIAAAQAGHDVVMSPTSHLYLDYAQAKGPKEPESIGGHIDLRKVYSFDPVPGELTPAQAKHVLGAQGNLWSEYLWDYPKVEYFAFPRLIALAELAWTPQAQRDYADFQQRLPAFLARLDAWKVNYRPLDVPAAGQWRAGEVTDAWSEREWDLGPAMVKPGAYEIRFQFTGGEHRLDIEWAALKVAGQEVARDAHVGQTGAKDEGNVYALRLPAQGGKPVVLRARVRADGGADSNGDIRVRRMGD